MKVFVSIALAVLGILVGGALFFRSDKEFIKAVEGDNLSRVRLLLRLHADPNARVSDGGHSVLHIAAGNGNPEIVDLLLKAGADPNYYGVSGAISARPLLSASAGEYLLENAHSRAVDGRLESIKKSSPELADLYADPVFQKNFADPNSIARYKKVEAILEAAQKNK